MDSDGTLKTESKGDFSSGFGGGVLEKTDSIFLTKVIGISDTLNMFWGYDTTLPYLDDPSYGQLNGDNIVFGSFIKGSSDLIVDGIIMDRAGNMFIGGSGHVEIRGDDQLNLYSDDHVDIDGSLMVSEFNITATPTIDFTVTPTDDFIATVGDTFHITTGNGTKIYGGLEADVTTKITGTIANNDATPDVSGGSVFTYAGSANTVTITDFDNPNIRTDIRIIGNSDTWTVTINDGGNFQCPSGNIVLGAGDVANFWIAADNDYIYIGGSDNN